MNIQTVATDLNVESILSFTLILKVTLRASDHIDNIPSFAVGNHFYFVNFPVTAVLTV